MTASAQRGKRDENYPTQKKPANVNQRENKILWKQTSGVKAEDKGMGSREPQKMESGGF